ncbi:MAG: DUF3943 domain-containing protein [Bacteroidales bacterium]|nr:DUF3943 domain-containing protein [Bacteroidales bacterium]
MKKFILIVLIFTSVSGFSQNRSDIFNIDTIFAYNNPENKEKHFIKAGLEVVGINAFVNCFDRFVLDADFAKISFKTIKHNIEYGPVWDNDKFATNLFFHPYHGNLYFNSARSNGLSFFQSAPYAFAGSLMWEMCGEIEPAAINDLIATTAGGICLGEITYRLSDLVLDDSSIGWERFFRELLCTAISPMKGFNRILDGKAWKVRHNYYKYHDFKSIPVKFSATLGDRYLCDHAHFTKGENNPFINVGVVYGDVFADKKTSPYDYFTMDVTAGLSKNQPLITHVSMLGRLWGLNIPTGTPIKIQFGLFQNFNYYNSEAVFEGSADVPYRISEAASVGTGFIYEFPKVGNINKLTQRIFFNGILLGGSASDYYNYIDRDYNMGSGFSARLNTYIEFAEHGAFTLNAEYYRIFTWKGYEKKDYTSINPLYLNSQGDKSAASLLVISPKVEFFLTKSWDLELSAYYFRRKTNYDYFEDVQSKTFELRVGMKYHI